MTLILLRNFRVLHALTAIRDFDLILQTFRRFASPMIHMLFTMYVINSMFCAIGMYCFRTGVTIERMALYT